MILENLIIVVKLISLIFYRTFQKTLHKIFFFTQLNKKFEKKANLPKAVQTYILLYAFFVRKKGPNTFHLEIKGIVSFITIIPLSNY